MKSATRAETDESCYDTLAWTLHWQVTDTGVSVINDSS